MRKHNKAMASRWGRSKGDRTNFASSISHKMANSKQFQLASNGLLKALLRRV